MKVYTMALLLGVAIGAIAVQGLHAQGAKPKAYAAGEKALAEPADKTALLSELMKLEAASWQSLKDRNLSAMNKYLADDAVLIFGDGSHFTKSEFIKAMPDIRLDSFTIEPNAEIKVWTPEVATLLYRITYTSAFKAANASTAKVLSSSTYVRSNDTWLSAIYQETPAP
jgi:cobalamin biosynthesis Mg chelatase CobN